jgi:putative two-component system response regulator
MIPIEARIVAVADVYDALRTARPYKEAFSPEKTLKIMLEGSGTQFDPQVLSVFASIYDEIEETLLELRDEAPALAAAA